MTDWRYLDNWHTGVSVNGSCQTYSLPMQLRGPREKGRLAGLLSDSNSVLSESQRSGMNSSGRLKLSAEWLAHQELTETVVFR